MWLSERDWLMPLGLGYNWSGFTSMDSSACDDLRSGEASSNEES